MEMDLAIYVEIVSEWYILYMEVTMTRKQIIDNTLSLLNALDEVQLKEVNDFAHFIYCRYEDRILTKGIEKLSGQSLDFLENEPDIYSEEDLKEQYR